MLPMAFQRSSMVLAAVALRWTLSLENGIVVGAVGRQQQKPCALCADCVLGRFALMAGEIVAVDDVTWMKGRYELGFDVGLEYCAVHRCINDPGGQRDRRA